MFPYAIIFALSSIFSILVRTRAASRILAGLLVVVLTFFAGTRYEVGCDYFAYAVRFASLEQSTPWIQAFSQGEGGFHALALVVQDLGGSFSAFLLVCAALYMACLWRFSLHSDRPLTFITLSFPILVIQLGMSGLRQALATGFLMMALSAFVRLRRIEFAAWILLAMQFHTSAIAFLPLIYLIGRSVSIPRIVAALAILGPVAGWFLGDRMDVYADRYVQQIYGENISIGAWPRYLMVLFPFALFEWKRRWVKAAYPALFPLFRAFSLITFSMVIVGLFSSVALHRLVFYVMPASLLAFICFARALRNSRNGVLYLLLPFVVYGAYFAVWAFYSGHARSCYDPYESWLLMQPWQVH